MELERIVIGLIAAALLPYSIPALRTRTLVSPCFSVGLAAYVLLPVTLSWKAFVLVAVCAAASWVLTWVAGRDQDMQGPPGILIPASVRKFTLVPSAVTSVMVLATLLVYGIPEMFLATRELILDDRTTILAAGLCIATFVGGEAVTHTLRPFSAELKMAEQKEMETLRGAGTVIGWLERSLTYLFTVAGMPEAVAVVVAIKGLARFPELQSHQKRFAEYFLIGTMSSIGVALLVAAIVRAVIGEKALG